MSVHRLIEMFIYKKSCLLITESGNFNFHTSKYAVLFIQIMSYNNFTALPHDSNGYSIKYDLDQEVVGEGIYVRFDRNNSWRQCWTCKYTV